jgi:hypothetical protein
MNASMIRLCILLIVVFVLSTRAGISRTVFYEDDGPGSELCWQIERGPGGGGGVMVQCWCYYVVKTYTERHEGQSSSVILCWVKKECLRTRKAWAERLV